jgi:hypothetical protein
VNFFKKPPESANNLKRIVEFVIFDPSSSFSSCLS